MQPELIEDERVARVLRECIEIQEAVEEGDADKVERLVNTSRDGEDYIDNWRNGSYLGISVDDVPAQGWEFNQLKGVLEKVFDSNSSSHYRIRDIEEAKSMLPRARGGDGEEQGESYTEEDLMGLFDDVVGHVDKRKWFRKTLEADNPVHHLLVGKPGTGKSTILDDILDLPGAEMVVGAGRQSTAAGVTEVLTERQPDILVVEEIEKMRKSDAEALLTLCGNGYVKTSKSGSNQKVELDTKVFASANVKSKVSPESLVSRLMVWEFEEYSLEEYEDVCVGTLPEKCGVGEEVAKEIANVIYEEMGTTDPREAERVASLISDEEDIRPLVKSME